MAAVFVDFFGLDVSTLDLMRVISFGFDDICCEELGSGSRAALAVLNMPSKWLSLRSRLVSTLTAAVMPARNGGSPARGLR